MMTLNYSFQHSTLFSEGSERKKSAQSSKRRRKRSFSTEYFVETLVVVDNSMMEYYKNEDINTYIFTIMNMVGLLFVILVIL